MNLKEKKKKKDQSVLVPRHLNLLKHDIIVIVCMFVFRLSNSALNNEFFAKACHEWRERLAEGI